jgi:hypothetical protein
LSVVSWVAPAPCGERAAGSSSCSRGTLLIPTIQGVVSTVRSSSRATIPRYITAYHGYWIRKNMTKRKGADSSAVWCIHCTVLTPRLPSVPPMLPHATACESGHDCVLSARRTCSLDAAPHRISRSRRTLSASTARAPMHPCSAHKPAARMHPCIHERTACTQEAPPMHPRANRVHPGSSSVADQRMNAAWEAWSC